MSALRFPRLQPPRAIWLVSALGVALTSLALAPPVLAQPKTETFTTSFRVQGVTEQLTWSVSGITNIEYFGSYEGNYRGDTPAFGKSIGIEAEITPTEMSSPPAGCSSDRIHSLNVYGYNWEWLDGVQVRCSPGKPCPPDGESATLSAEGSYEYWPFPAGAFPVAITYERSGGCLSDFTAVLQVLPSSLFSWMAWHPQQMGGPEAKPFVRFIGGDGDEGGGGGGDPPTPEDCPLGGCDQCPAGMTCEDGDFGQCPAVTINGCPGPSGPNACGGGSFGQSQGLPGYWVDTALLMPVVKDTDYVMVGDGPPVRMTRTWTPTDTSHEQFGAMFGPNWSFAYDVRLDGGFCGKAIVWTGRGGGKVFSPPGGACADPPAGQSVTYVAEPGNGDTLTYFSGVGTADRFEFLDSLSGYVYRLQYVGGSGAGYLLAAVTDKHGQSVTISRNPDGTIASITDANGNVTTFTHDASRRCTSMTTADGLTASYTYDANGRLATATDLLGTVSTFTYDAAGHVTGFSAGGRAVTFLYGQTNTVVSRRKFLAGISHDNGATWTVIDPPVEGAGQQVVNVKSPSGRARQFTTRDGVTIAAADLVGTTAFEYDTHRRPTKITKPDGSSVTYQYDADGNLQRFVDAAGRATTYAYDAARRMTTKTNNALGQWRYGWDQKDRLTSLKTPAGRETTFTRDAKGRVTRISGGGTSVSFSYDAGGRVAGVLDPLDRQTTFGYDARGNVTQVVNPLGQTTRLSYDANNRLTKVATPDGAEQQFGYDACAATGGTDANGHTTSVARNADLYPIAVSDGAGRSFGFRYDADNNLRSTDRGGFSTGFTYDAAGRLVAIGNGRVTGVQNGQPTYENTVRFTLDAAGRLTTLTNERGKSTTYTYDASGLWLTATDPDGHVVSVARDGQGRVRTLTNAREQVLTYDYDADGRLLRTSLGATVLATYEREAETGRLLAVTDASGRTAYAYDTVGDLASVTAPDGKQLQIERDAGARVTRLQYAGGFAVGYEYDGAGRLTRVSWPGGYLRKTYDPVGNVVLEQRSNATETRYTYDAGNLVARIEHTAGGAPFARFVFTRDGAGRIVEEQRLLPEAPTVAVPASVPAATFGDSNQQTAAGTDSYVYDADGNLTGITGGRAWSATFDAENRLTSLSRPADTRTFVNDAGGRRVQVTSGGAQQRFFYDTRDRLLWETDGAGNVAAYYVYTATRLQAKVTPAGHTYFYHHDVRGSTVAMTDTTGAVANAYAYGPFGEVVRRRESVGNRFTYVGAYGVQDDGDGLYYMRHRYYDARDGRFVSRDPLGFAGGFNLYGYAGGDSANGIDPSGLSPFGPDPPLPQGWLDEIRPRRPYLSDPRTDPRAAAAYRCISGVVANGLWSGIEFGAAVTVGGPVGLLYGLLALDNIVSTLRYASGRTPAAYDGPMDEFLDIVSPWGDGGDYLLGVAGRALRRIVSQTQTTEERIYLDKLREQNERLGRNNR